MLAYKGQCILAVLVTGKPVVIQAVGVVLFTGSEAGHPMWFHLLLNPVVLPTPVKPDLGRLLGQSLAKVPLPTVAGDIALFFQSRGEGDHIRCQAATVPGIDHP